MLRNIDIELTLQPSIDGPPKSQGDIYKQACSGDETTVNTWRDTWIGNYKTNHDKFGSFKNHSVSDLYGANRHKPAIVIGSGPSLKLSIEALKENAAMEFPVLTISCLHNFGLFEDEGIHADYYVTLDAGEIILKDVSEGRAKDPEHYWEKTRGKTLLAYASSPPELFEKWQGNVLLFNCLIPDTSIRKEYENIERFPVYVSSGGNCLGGSMYIAKAIMGSSTIIYVGADFCFDYDGKTFHSYETEYDAPGQFVVWPSQYGIMRRTWPSYLNFKFWADHIATTVPGEWISCSEGLMGAYREGNIKQFKYMTLKDALSPYKIADELVLEKRKGGESTRETILVKDVFQGSDYDKDLVFF